VVEAEERKGAANFRNYLLDEGFTMAQFSANYKLVGGGRRRFPSMRNALRRPSLPREGWIYSASQTSSMGILSLSALESGETGQKGRFNTAYSDSASVFSASKSSYFLPPKGVAAPLL